jgi:3-oxoadipate enol-lactonase
MPTAKINGIDLYYEVHGEGPALVFAHGGGGNHLSWWQQVAAFSSQFRCVTFDHRCFGVSRDVTDGPGPRAFVEDLRQLLDSLDISKAALIGQSMGGWTVFGFAATYPERVSALVLCDTSAGLDDPEVARAQADAVRAGPRGSLAQVLTRAYAPDFPRRDPARFFLYQEITALNQHVPQSLIPSLMSVKHRPDAIIERHVPTLLIVGEEDALAPPPIMEQMARTIPHSRLVKIPGAGHSPYFEKADQFNEIVGSFLREHAKA